uniref:Uncharacterized protein TCIL3000_11_13480 n=1 Tax=Trypanosoma congolense (strain IL3000) TaxID=1068625 RepID=G0V2H0_TRYCI|nr:unnamed protein product [Trypanosoma congolense IL3000]
MGEEVVNRHQKRLIVPLRLHVPVVTIDRPKKGPPWEHDGRIIESHLNVDTERGMIARLRELQVLRDLHQHSPSIPLKGKLLLKSAPEVKPCVSTAPCGVGCNNKVTPPPRSSKVNVAAPLSAGSKGAPDNFSLLPLAETAVPPVNISLFKSDVGSRYFQFTRTLGLWEYLTVHSGLSSAAGTTAVDRKEITVKDNNGSSDIRSSVGPDDAATSHMDRGTQANTQGVPFPVRRKPHRRRTNRTHAEKRARRSEIPQELAQRGS